ncbi:hypothetical protein SteCoe_257 [Stentor coeruleus]|uniref:MARVEL domain-containing protein n=1 Tax=Stentor coeruleus TaxID=5963 RepID=A0A1R2D505_9CILI|nr:hypothetical protein SteCoe_257 [Stentor coeruleus]
MSDAEAKRQLEELNKAMMNLDNAINQSKHQHKTHEKSQYYLGIGSLPFLIAIIIVLNSDGECGAHIRTWLECLCYTFIVTLIISIANLVAPSPGLAGASGIVISLLSLFQLIWYIIGTVWFFSEDNNCDANWHAGYVMSLVMVIWFLVQLGIVLLICCCVCCAAGIALGASSKN